MSNLAPARIVRMSLRVLYVSAPLCALILLGWAQQLMLSDRPFLALMLFLLALTGCAVALVGIIFGLCHASIAEAFAVGVRTGQTTPAAAVRPAHGPDLRIVE